MRSVGLAGFSGSGEGLSGITTLPTMLYSILTMDRILILGDGVACSTMVLQRSSLSETTGANAIRLLSERGLTSDISS